MKANWTVQGLKWIDQRVVANRAGRDGAIET
jgi:hypothetical protein